MLIITELGEILLQVAFKIGDFKQQVVFIGGLKEGILAAELVFQTVVFQIINYFWNLLDIKFCT